MRRGLIAAVVVLTMAAVLAVNAMLVGLQTRPAVARSGGALMETDSVTANVKVEGEGPPIVLIHGFGAALDPVPPLLVIFGTQDALISPDSAKLFETVPGAKLVMIDGAGHSPMVEKPAETLAQIEGFID